jgi:hypothetical protein
MRRWSQPCFMIDTKRSPRPIGAQTQPNLNTSLSSLALLSLRMGEGDDYLDYLRGFVIASLRFIRTLSFDAQSVQTTGIIMHRDPRHYANNLRNFL